MINDTDPSCLQRIIAAVGSASKRAERRDIATACLQGMLTAAGDQSGTYLEVDAVDRLARYAIIYADALLQKLDKEEDAS